jgi:predicted GNAT family N-acyltransferase
MADQQAEAARLAAHRRDLNQRLRLAFVAGAEERSRETVGRGLTEEALELVIERYPDLPVRVLTTDTTQRGGRHRRPPRSGPSFRSGGN